MHNITTNNDHQTSNLKKNSKKLRTEKKKHIKRRTVELYDITTMQDCS